MDGKKGLRRGLLLSLAIIFSFVLGVLSPLEIVKRKSDSLELFEEIYNVLEEHWYYGDDKEMISRAINSLYTTDKDPFTFLLEKDTTVMDTASGKGIGISISDYGGYILIEKVFNSANKAVLRVGDIIVEVDGTSLDGKTFEESSKILSDATSKNSFNIKVLREHEEVTVHVAMVNYADNITVELLEENDKYLALKIHEFGAYTGTEFGKFIEDYKDSDNLIIDLRGNPGGYITSVINVASYLLPNHTPVMSVKDRDDNSTTYYTENKSHYTFNHIYVMIDDESASGAEALTLCLKDNAEKIEDLNVTVVGQTTYGKGSAQQDYELSNGYSIHVTYAKWYSPNGTNIDKIGVDPTPTHNLDFIDYENYYFTYESLKFEDHNNKVLKLQYQLKYLGYEDIRVHGFFDEITEMAIKDIQTKKGLDVDGKLTLATFNIIKRAIVDKKLEQSEKEYNYVISLIGA